MKFKIVAVGKIKEKFFADATSEYSKRISRFASLEIFEVAECTFNGSPNQSQIEKILTTEGQAILTQLKGFVVALDIKGKSMGSVEMSQYIENLKQSNSQITFVIGGSFGLWEGVKNRADMLWSMGKITLPHQLARVVLCEQIYRIMTLQAGSTYHK